MTKNAEVEVPARAKLGIRPGVSRKLLERKAVEAAAAAGEPAGEALEDSFPADVPDQADAAAIAGVETSASAIEHAANEHARTSIGMAAATVPVPAAGPQELGQTTPEQPARRAGAKARHRHCLVC